MSLFRRSGIAGSEGIGDLSLSSDSSRIFHRREDHADAHHSQPSSQQQNETRFQSFQQSFSTSNNPWRKYASLILIVTSVWIYSVGLLGWRSESSQFLSHDSVVKVNERGIQLAKLQKEKRIKRAEQRKEERRRRNPHVQQDANNATIGQDTNNKTQMIKNSTSSNATITRDDAETMVTLQKQQSASQNFFESVISFLTTMFIFTTVLTIVRAGLRICVLLTLGHFGSNSNGRSNGRSTTRARRQVQFRTWAENLNRQRRLQGERPLSLDSLRLVVGDRDLSDGNDYEGLLQFNEESGPAVESLIRNIGATWEEINRCPQRKLKVDDDLLKPRDASTTATRVTGTNTNGTSSGVPECAVCLEPFQQGDWVRTIPCFHSFHRQCIDPWLSSKAECPVCKHTAII